MPRLTIDFINMTMNTTLATDKRVPPVFTEIRNADIEVEGRFRKRHGYSNWSTNASPNAGSGSVGMVAPAILNDFFSTIYAISGADIYYNDANRTDAWTDTSINAYSGWPYQLSWGLNASGKNVLYVAYPIQGLWGLFNDKSAPVKYGYASDASNPWENCACGEWWLNRLWVGNVQTHAGTEYRNRLYYSVTGNDNDFYSSGSGYLSLTPPGYPYIDALRVYRDNLYVATSGALMMITGTTEDTFGSEYIRPIRSIQRATMYVVDDFMYWADVNGIWEFDGSTAVNLTERDQVQEWRASRLNGATATWDEEQGIYSVYFSYPPYPILNYHYREKRWTKNIADGSTAFRVISPPIGYWGTIKNPIAYLAGGITGGKVYLIDQNYSQDDGTAITADIETGQLPLGGVGNEVRIKRMFLYAAKQTTQYTVKLDVVIDGGRDVTPTQLTLTIPAAASAQDFPTRYTFDTLVDSSGNETATGEYFKFKLTCDTNNVREDIRAFVIDYEVLEEAAR